MSGNSENKLANKKARKFFYFILFFNFFFPTRKLILTKIKVAVYIHTYRNKTIYFVRNEICVVANIACMQRFLLSIFMA